MAEKRDRQTVPDQAPPNVLLVTDVARIGTEVACDQYEQAHAHRQQVTAQRAARGLKAPWQWRNRPLAVPEPLKPSTVWSWVKESQETVGKRPGRYADRPIPPPAGRIGKVLWWHKRDEKKLRDWIAGRPGQGHGTGGRHVGTTHDVADAAR